MPDQLHIITAMVDNNTGIILWKDVVETDALAFISEIDGTSNERHIHQLLRYQISRMPAMEDVQ
jgi:hypothetical protein